MLQKQHLILVLATISAIALSSSLVDGKVFKKCEVVRKLEEYGISKPLIPTFLCLSESESGMNSSTKTTIPSLSVTSYGIFQANNRNWCRDEYKGGACNVRCSDLIKDDLKASIECADVRQKRNGFKDWPTFEKKCRPTNLPNIRDCNK